MVYFLNISAILSVIVGKYTCSQDWVSVLDDEEDQSGDPDLEDWATLETMRSSHPIHFAQQISEVIVLVIGLCNVVRLVRTINLSSYSVKSVDHVIFSFPDGWHITFCICHGE